MDAPLNLSLVALRERKISTVSLIKEKKNGPLYSHDSSLSPRDRAAAKELC
jgi:hypothetical protein